VIGNWVVVSELHLDGICRKFTVHWIHSVLVVLYKLCFLDLDV
jgi:hypothetical protein